MKCNAMLHSIECVALLLYEGLIFIEGCYYAILTVVRTSAPVIVLNFHCYTSCTTTQSHGKLLFKLIHELFTNSNVDYVAAFLH